MERVLSRVKDLGRLVIHLPSHAHASQELFARFSSRSNTFNRHVDIRICKWANSDIVFQTHVDLLGNTPRSSQVCLCPSLLIVGLAAREVTSDRRLVRLLTSSALPLHPFLQTSSSSSNPPPPTPKKKNWLLSKSKTLQMSY